jgi:hypothetical protein
MEAYSSDPSWAARGPPLLEEPRLAGGRLVIELSSVKEAPKAVENFRCLCTGRSARLTRGLLPFSVSTCQHR